MFWIGVGFWGLFLLVWFCLGFFNIKQDELTVLERNGAFLRISRPGLRWRRLRSDQIVNTIYTSDYLVPLVVPERKLSFQGAVGGPKQVILKGAKAYVQLIYPFEDTYVDDQGFDHCPVYRVFYRAGDWKKLVPALLSDCVSMILQRDNFLGTISLEEPTPLERISQPTADRLKRWGLRAEISFDIQA